MPRDSIEDETSARPPRRQRRAQRAADYRQRRAAQAGESAPEAHGTVTQAAPPHRRGPKSRLVKRQWMTGEECPFQERQAGLSPQDLQDLALEAREAGFWENLVSPPGHPYDVDRHAIGVDPGFFPRK